MACEFRSLAKVHGVATVKGRPVAILQSTECGIGPTAIWPDAKDRPVELCARHLRWAIQERMIRLGLWCRLPPTKKQQEDRERRRREFLADVWRGKVDPVKGSK